MREEKQDKKEKVVIFGTGSFAEVAYYYLVKDSPYDVVGFTAEKLLIIFKGGLSYNHN